MLTTEWGPVGTRGLVLVLVATRSSGDCVEQTGRTPTRTSTRPPHPLHPAPCPYRTRDAPFSIRLSNIIRTLGTQAFRWCNYPIRLSPFCRDKGWIWGRVGALCLSLVATRSSGDCVEQPGRTPTRTSTRPNTVQICAMARSILLILALPYTLRFSLFEQYCPLRVSGPTANPLRVSGPTAKFK